MTLSPNLDEIFGTWCAACAEIKSTPETTVEFRVAPADGGGWDVWAAALGRFVGRLAEGPGHVVIVDQRDLTQRYVQVIVGWGTCWAEVSSNAYLFEPSKLSAAQEELLDRMGWTRPVIPDNGDDADSDVGMNWTRPDVRHDWPHVVDLVVAAVSGVLEFSPHHPIGVQAFRAHRPCKACMTGDDSADVDVSR